MKGKNIYNLRNFKTHFYKTSNKKKYLYYTEESVCQEEKLTQFSILSILSKKCKIPRFVEEELKRIP